MHGAMDVIVARAEHGPNSAGVEALIAEPAIGSFHMAVLHGPAGLDVTSATVRSSAQNAPK